MEKQLKTLEQLKITKELEKEILSNTGGMGAYSPSRLINDTLEEKILKIIKPTLEGLAKFKTKYKGFLYGINDYKK